MSSVCPDTDPAYNGEIKMYDLEAELVSEICSCLGAHDQLNLRKANEATVDRTFLKNLVSTESGNPEDVQQPARVLTGADKVCKWWRLNLSEAFLSRLVDMDDFRMFNQSEDFLEHALNMLVKKNTKILVLRCMVFMKNEFGIVARVIKQKQADLIQIILKDCEVSVEFAADAYYWLRPDQISDCMMHGLISVTKKLVLVNYTMRSALSSSLFGFQPRMPCNIPIMHRQNIFKELPIVLPEHEFDCTKPFQEHYHSFILALNNNCPEVCPEIQKQVMLLYNSWIHSVLEERQWKSLGVVIKCLNDGVPITAKDYEVNVSSLLHLDPLTLNKLTVEALHRLYF